MMLSLKNDKDIYERLEIKDPVEETWKVITAFRRRTAPIIIILSHLGFEADKIFAATLPRGHGVNFIIGGHTHTPLDEPCIVNGIPIVQLGEGSGIKVFLM